jgi:hypothetical protein
MNDIEHLAWCLHDVLHGVNQWIFLIKNCDVAQVVIIYKNIYPHLAISKT